MTRLLASLLALSMIGASPDSPRICGGKNIEMGGGFHLRMYMFAGSGEFDLEYDVPQSAVIASGIVVAATPIRLTFSRLSAANSSLLYLIKSELFGSDIGYANLDAREFDGRSFHAQSLLLDCGNGHHLSAHFSAPPHEVSREPGPISFPSPFFGDKDIPACYQDLEKGGRYRLTFFRNNQSPPVLTAQGVFPLKATMVAAQGLWERDLARAKRGECVMMPPPPPPP